MRIPADRLPWLIAVSAILMLAADRPWNTKSSASWTEEDARQILTESPWAKTVKAMIVPLQTEDERRQSGNMGQPHGIGFDGIAGYRPRVQPPKSIVDVFKPEAAAPSVPMPSLELQVRWESALPVQVAELKAHVGSPPTSIDDGYVLAVYGVPDDHFKGGDPMLLGEPFKNQANLQREGKKDVRPSRVEVFDGEKGLKIFYRFPLAAEILRGDRKVQFRAQIGRIVIDLSFDLEQMLFQAKLAV